jgi:hypothetical protein
LATQTRLLDDLDRTSDGVRTHRFGIDAQTWEIDLSPDNLAALHTALAPFINAGRRATTKTTAKRGRTGGSSVDEETRREIRAWWADNHTTAGLPVPNGGTGRIPEAVVTAYHASRTPRP